MDKAMQVNYYVRDSSSISNDLYKRKKKDKLLVNYLTCSRKKNLEVKVEENMDLINLSLMTIKILTY